MSRMIFKVSAAFSKCRISSRKRSRNCEVQQQKLQPQYETYSRSKATLLKVFVSSDLARFIPCTCTHAPHDDRRISGSTSDSKLHIGVTLLHRFMHRTQREYSHQASSIMQGVALHLLVWHSQHLRQVVEAAQTSSFS